jgi:hypothetical protein
MWLKQGMGRLIRSRRDRGAICVLDVRLLASHYGAYFLESLPPSPVTTRYEDVVKFFSAEPRGDVSMRESVMRSPGADRVSRTGRPLHDVVSTGVRPIDQGEQR